MKTINTHIDHTPSSGDGTNYSNIERHIIMMRIFPNIVMMKKPSDIDGYVDYTFRAFIRKADRGGQYYLIPVMQRETVDKKRPFNDVLFKFLWRCYTVVADYDINDVESKHPSQFHIKDLNIESETNRTCFPGTINIIKDLNDKLSESN
jgi:hypothetical protein